MGAYSDSRILTRDQRRHIMNTIINPVVRATGFTGFLYAGLMMTSEGPSVLEFNVRLGDPETQPLMMRLESDWGEALMAAAQGELPEGELEWSPEPATCVVLASAGYPGEFQTGRKITGIEERWRWRCGLSRRHRTGEWRPRDSRRPRARRHRAGRRSAGQYRPRLRRRSKIHFEGMQYRKDIGAKGLRRYNRWSGT